MHRSLRSRSRSRSRRLAVALGVTAVVTACSSESATTTATSTTTAAQNDLLTNVETFPVPSRDHVDGPVDYPQDPPVGGDHAPAWQNCGFYSEPIANENAVHSMEHGAAWIAFDPDLDADQVSELRRLARQPYTLVAPYPRLDDPIVVSAWGVQLRLQSADDPALASFLTAFRQGPDTPEPGAVCDGALGRPA